MAAIEVKLGPRFEVELPSELCERVGVEPGQSVYVFERDGALHIVRRAIQELRGMCKGMKWSANDRDRNDRF